MRTSWLLAPGIFFLLEGVVPFLIPKQWREIFPRMTRFSDGQIRFLGLIALLGGAIAIALVHISS